MTIDELKDPQKFSALVPGLLQQARLEKQHERQLWEWRQKALRGTTPVALFTWCMRNRDKVAMSSEDEKRAGVEMQREHGRQLNEAFQNPQPAMDSRPAQERPLNGPAIDAKFNAARRYCRARAVDRLRGTQKQEFRAAASEILGRNVRGEAFSAVWEELMQREIQEHRRNVTEPPVPNKASRRRERKRNRPSDDCVSLSDVVDQVLPKARLLSEQMQREDAE